MTVTLPNAGRIVFRSLDNPDNARGHTADGVVIDEVGHIKPAAWYEVLRPMLIDTGGWGLLRIFTGRSDDQTSIFSSFGSIKRITAFLGGIK